MFSGLVRQLRAGLAGENRRRHVLGLPHNLADKISRHVDIVHPQGGNSGSIELIEVDGASGRSFSSEAHPPNLGITSLRFPVNGIEALARRLEGAGTHVIAAPAPRALNGTQSVQHMIVRGSGGEWLELLEILD